MPTEIQLCRLHTRGSWQTLYWSQFLSTWTYYYQQKLHFGPIFINKSCFSANVPQKSSRMVVMSSVISLVIIPHDRKQMSFIFINTNQFLSTIFVFLSTLRDFYQQSLCFYQHELHTSNKPCGYVYRYRITIESCTATFSHNDAGHFYQHLLSFLSTSCFFFNIVFFSTAMWL